MYSAQELAIRLRMRQSELQREIESEGGNKITPHLCYLIHCKTHTDAVLSDIAGELGWDQGFDKMLDREILSRETGRVWGNQ